MKWYGGCGAALLLSLIPVLLWLIPVLRASSNNFAFWLLWEQTAGRVTGNFGAAHVRPVYFYLPLILVLFAPWLFFPSFWRRAKSLPSKIKTESGYRFLLCWLAPVFLTFSLISGKQPHYLLPLLPGVIILVSTLITSPLKRIALVSVSMILMTMVGQIIAARTVFKNYDLQPVADYVRAHPHHDWAAVPKYQGEITFLGRLDHPVDAIPANALQKWFLDHPNGLAMIRYSDPSEVKGYTMLFDMPYRSRRLVIIKRSI